MSLASDSPTPMTPGIRSVLVVCTGNICRSPYAHLRLQELAPDLEVSSAGIGALVGHPMEEAMRDLLSAHGVSADGFAARQVDAAAMQADLIVTMSRRQRDYLIEEFPAAARRIVLLDSVDVLTELLDGGLPLDQAITVWSRRRPSASAEVPDPYRRSPEVAREVAARLDRAVETLAAALLR